MPFTQEDLAQLGAFMDAKITTAIEGATQVATANRVAVVGTPDVPPDAGPEFWVHLADGSVIETHDSQSTHMLNADGVQVPVIGRYQKGQ
jgi:hypothetical protein